MIQTISTPLIASPMLQIHSLSSFSCRNVSFHALSCHCLNRLTIRSYCFQKKQILQCCSASNLEDGIFPEGEKWKLQCSEENRRRRYFLLFSTVSFSLFMTSYASGKVKNMSSYDENRLLQQNKKIQEANNAPENFPKFVREGFRVKVVTSDNYLKRDSGLIYLDIEVGKGDCPKAGQQVTFHYVGYNESGRRIDSTYLQGSPAKIRLGTKQLVPGFEEGIRDMKPGGKRRIIIPPELGPPVGPSTFFSSKQFEVFDVELLSLQDCERRTIAFYSDIVCN